MSIFFAMFLGLVQGLTEFLPVSSSGHLSILQNLFGMNSTEGHLFFDVLLHLGTLVSVFIMYRKDIREMIASVVGLFKKDRSLIEGFEDRRPSPAGRLVVLIVIATLPLFLIVPFNDRFEQLYYNTTFVGFALLITGALLFVADKIVPGTKNERTATVKNVLLVGAAQMIAVIPGISRSGSTITLGLLQGFDRDFAVKFSFLLSIPAILGANILSLIKTAGEGVDTSLLPAYFAGFAIAAISGCFAINIVKRITRKGRFGKFAYYCWALGALAIVASLL